MALQFLNYKTHKIENKNIFSNNNFYTTFINRLVKDYIDSISKQLVKSMNNDTYSFAEISSTYGVKSDVIFVYQGRDYSNDMLNSEYLTLEKTLASDAKAPISFELSVVDNKYLVKFDYLYKYYDEAFVDSFIDAFDVATNNLKNSDLLKDVSILSDKALAFIDAFISTAKSLE